MSTPPSDRDVERLTGAVHLLIRALLIAGRAGQPAEGKLPFNALYFHMLGVLYERGALRPSHLASTLNVARTTLSTASKALQKRGLVQQTVDPQDGRAHLLRLTVEGRDITEAIRRQDRRNMRSLLERVDPERRNIVIEVLEQVSEEVSV